MRKTITILLLLCLVVSPAFAYSTINVADITDEDRMHIFYYGSVAFTGAVHLATQAHLTSENATLHYTITGIASKQLPTMTIMPQIWKRGSPDNVLVFTGEPVTCTNAKNCQLVGTFTPIWNFANVTATYFTEGAMLYSVPDKFLPSEARGRTGQYDLTYTSGDTALVPEVVVTRTLNLLEPGKVADPANANNTVPLGGMIEHGMLGNLSMTVVYDASGQPQFLADDRKAAETSTPHGGMKRATWVHEVPSGTFINETSETSLEYSLNGEKIGSIQSYISYPAEKVSNANAIAPTWVEFAEAHVNAGTLGEFSAQWEVPSRPSELRENTKLAMFNSIAPRDGSAIFQPVLEYHWRDTPSEPDPGPVYTAAVWDLGKGDFTHSSRISKISTGDTVVGDIKWQNGVWYGQITKAGSETSTTWISKYVKDTPLELDFTLEGYDCVDYKQLPGYVNFNKFFTRNRNGQIFLPTFTGTVNRDQWPSDRFPYLGVRIRQGSLITLAT